MELTRLSSAFLSESRYKVVPSPLRGSSAAHSCHVMPCRADNSIAQMDLLQVRTFSTPTWPCNLSTSVGTLGRR